jgi:hypothetical protein
MRVFDDIDRSKDDAAAYSEPHFTYLNRTARRDFAQVRALVDEWFSRYPVAHQKGLLPRLRSRRDGVFSGAFFELYIHEVLLRLGYSIEVHPPNPSGARTHPDFFAYGRGGAGLYVEATFTGDESDAEAAAQARINRAYDALNRIDSADFFLHPEDHGSPATPVPMRFRAEVARFLMEQDYERCVQLFAAGGFAALPTGRFEHDGWTVTYSPIPKKKSARGQPGLRPIAVTGPAEPYRLDNVTALRTAVRRKAGKYGNLDQPLIIAVNAASQRLSDYWVMAALFGSECAVTRGGVKEVARVPDGVWTGIGGPQRQRVSAVLIASSLSPWSVAKQPITLYHHPWAHRPCLDALAELPQAVPSNDRTRVELRKGMAPHTLFELSEDWPGD